jgi:hypothetical protein
MVMHASARDRETGAWHVECYAHEVMSNGDRDEHLEVLRAMWGEMKTLNARINTTNERLDEGFSELRAEFRAELRETREFLGARIDATNERIDRLTDEVRDGFAQTRFDRKRLDRLEKRVEDLERRPK